MHFQNGSDNDSREVVGSRSGFAYLACASQGAPLPSGWQHEQHFDAPAPGLVKLSVPVETLDFARPGLEDLRLYDDAGAEVPYRIERPRSRGEIIQSPKTFRVSLQGKTTVLTLESGLTQPLDGIALETPAITFIKSVQIEGSSDGERWQILERGQPIFRQAGASQLQLTPPSGKWPWLRLTIDDRRSEPIPVTGARLRAATVEAMPAEGLPVSITERHENPGETRVTLNLGAANLDLATIEVETSEPLFTRPVTLAVPQVAGGAVREVPVAQGVIYRVAVEGQPLAARLSVNVEAHVPSRELLLLIKNQDSPPLAVTAVRARRRPVFLLFHARSPGVYHLFTGNSRCAAPRYDLAALGETLKPVEVSTIQLSRPAENPDYRPPEVLPGIEEGGSAIDLAPWAFRKMVRPGMAGAQRIELDLEVLAHAQPDFADLRLARGAQQLPFILEPTSIQRPLPLSVTSASDKVDPRISRWLIKLPRPGLPLTRLTCSASTALFRRELVLHEEAVNERGEKYRRTLGTATWVRTPEHTGREFALRLEGSPRGESMVLETHNGDNPPLKLENFQAAYPLTRLLFKAQSTDELWLYYGQPDAVAPRYDLSLVAGQLLAADKAEASLGAEETLRKIHRPGPVPSQGGVLLWGILAVVVVVLLVIIRRLLPRAGGA